jgi:hypothetical protein
MAFFSFLACEGLTLAMPVRLGLDSTLAKEIEGDANDGDKFEPSGTFFFFFFNCHDL